MKEVLKIPLKATLYRHQQSACRFACERFGILPSETHSNGVALLMEMGCGKTITSIAIVGILYQYRHIRRILITAPLSILSVWEQEFARFAAFPYQLTILKGSSTQKKEQLSKLHGDGLQIAVVNYESAWRLEKELLAFDADLIIADEAHKIKENRTAQSKAMHHLGDKSRYKLLLTGTLITNKELDVFSQYRFLNKEIFGTSFYAFRSRYFDMCGYGNHIPVFRKQMMDEFLQKLHSVAYRVTKAECLDLPQITEEIRTVELEPKAMKLYKQLEKESFAELAGSEISAVNVLTKMLRLSQMTGGYLTDDAGSITSVSTAKLDALSDILDTMLAEGKKLVIMARFVPELNDIQKLLEQKQIGYASVRGGISDRAEEIRRFQEDADCKVFVGQIAAAGLGITLTAASTMVFYSLDYSMSNFEQAKARIHRVSQTENCLYKHRPEYKEQRTIAKNVNFGTFYGLFPKGLQNTLKFKAGVEKSIPECEEIIRNLKAGYPALTVWQNETKMTAKQKLYTETWLGRRRYLPNIRSDNWGLQSFAERCALNTPIQGTAADILKLAIVRILEGLPSRPWLRPILQIHDELTFLIPKDRLQEAVAFVKGCMEQQPFPEFDLPLVAEASAGESFGNLEELEE